MLCTVWNGPGDLRVLLGPRRRGDVASDGREVAVKTLRFDRAPKRCRVHCLGSGDDDEVNEITHASGWDVVLTVPFDGGADLVRDVVDQRVDEVVGAD